MCKCGKVGTITWVGKGSLCSECFEVERKKLNPEPEGVAKFEKIKKNFER